jgi:HlyD family secretion protein
MPNFVAIEKTMKLPAKIPRQVWFFAFGIALLAALGWVATQSGPLAPAKVTVARVVKGDVSPALFGIGTVEARRTYLIGPTVAGRVRRVLVDVGDSIKAGQLLAEMDPVDLDARVISAVAEAARAGSAVGTAQAQARDAKSRQEFAAGEARRYVELGRNHLVSQSEVDIKLQQQQSADAQLAAAESALTGARQDLARLEADRAGITRQRVNIRLEAPTDGVVTSRDAEPGSTVVAGQAVLTLEDPRSLWVVVRLDQGRSAGLRVGLPAKIVMRSAPGKPLMGKVVRVERISDSVTEERVADVGFERTPPEVSTNELAEVTLTLPTVTDALMVPNASIHYRGAETGVWLLADGHLRFAPVKTGAESLDGKMQILEGLRAGDEVVVYSQRALSDDTRIRVVSAVVGTAR